MFADSKSVVAMFADNKSVEHAIISFPATLIQSLLLFYLIRGEVIWLYYALIVVMSSIVNVGLKKLFRKPRPSDAPGDCGVYPHGGEKHTYGMPSGHCITIATACALLVFHIMVFSKDTMNETTRYVMSSLLIIVCALACWHRVYIKCHTPFQVAVGTLLGSVIGVGFGFLWKQLYK